MYHHLQLMAFLICLTPVHFVMSSQHVLGFPHVVPYIISFSRHFYPCIRERFVVSFFGDLM